MNTSVWTVLIIIHAFVTCIYLCTITSIYKLPYELQSYHITYAFVPLTVICKATISRICELFSVLFLTSYNNHTFTRPTKHCFSGSAWGFKKQSTLRNHITTAISCNIKDCDETTAHNLKLAAVVKARMEQFKRYAKQNNPKSSVYATIRRRIKHIHIPHKKNHRTKTEI